jgi:hypothetical protein
MEGFGSSRVENKVGGAGCYDKSFKYPMRCDGHSTLAELGLGEPVSGVRKSAPFVSICTLRTHAPKYIK